MAQKREIDEIPKEVLKGQFAAYFDARDRHTPSPLPYTLTGLALWTQIPLQELITYPEDGPLYTVVRHAKAKCENDLIDRMLSGQIDTSVGNMFLKNHFGYVDLAKAISAEEKKKQKELSRGPTISAILDAIEAKNNEKK